MPCLPCVCRYEAPQYLSNNIQIWWINEASINPLCYRGTYWWLQDMRGDGFKFQAKPICYWQVFMWTHPPPPANTNPCPVLPQTCPSPPLMKWKCQNRRFVSKSFEGFDLTCYIMCQRTSWIQNQISTFKLWTAQTQSGERSKKKHSNLFVFYNHLVFIFMLSNQFSNFPRTRWG